MSGICGLFNLDGAPVSDAELGAMTAMLERRGPERTGRWRARTTGLGHTLLATTPELRSEAQPFENSATGCVITADVRLDNRTELLDALQIGRPMESVGDAELIVNAYLKWGEGCVDRLLGDFAFALWDPRERKLFCVRDHLGMRPFYYHHAPGHRFVFASDARAILVLSQVPYRNNKGRIADFLVPQLEWIDFASTFFEDVYRLPPGHRAIISSRGLEISEYWKPEPEPELSQMSDDDYRDSFLEVFTRAVACRLRGPSQSVGSMLSGGLDSGSIVTVAKEILAAKGEQPFRTFSAVRRQPIDCAESSAIRAATAMPSLLPTLVYLEDLGPYLESLVSKNEEPFDGEAMLLKVLYQAAHAQRQRVLLDGAGGDVVLSEGSYIARLLQRGHIWRAFREIVNENRFWGGGILVSNSMEYLRTAYVPEFIKKRFREARLRHHIDHYMQSSLISRDFAASVAVEDRFACMRETFPVGWQRDYIAERCSVIRPSVTAGRERYARLAASNAVEARDPFLDKRVVDFCSRLPGHLRIRGGWPKIMLRDVMDSRLPEEVRWLPGKPHLGWMFNAVVTRKACEQGAISIGGLREGLADYVDLAKLDNAWRALRSDGDAQQIHSAHVLSVWLRENVKRPVVPE